MHGFGGDPQVTRYTDWGPNSPADTAAFLTGTVRDAESLPRSRFALAVVHRQDGVLIGSIELRIASGSPMRGEMGYVLGRPWWGRGYATEAATALLRLGLDVLGLRKVSAACHPANTASVRVLTKVGMRYEGRLSDHLYFRDQRQDRMIYAATA